LIQADLSDIQQVDALIGKLKDTVGRVDVLVNNAGQSINADIISMKPEQFDAQRALTKGVWYLTKRILRQFMIRNSAGRIINISSVVGHTGNAGQIPYTMEKRRLMLSPNHWRGNSREEIFWLIPWLPDSLIRR